MSFLSTVAFGLMAGAAVGFLAKKSREGVVTLDTLPLLPGEQILGDDERARFAYLLPSREFDRASKVAHALRPCVVRVTDRRIVVAQAQPFQAKLRVVRYVAHAAGDAIDPIPGVELFRVAAIRALEREAPDAPLVVIDADVHGFALETSASGTILARFSPAG